MSRPRSQTQLFVWLLSLILSTTCQARRLHVAVASNFMPTLQLISVAFKSKTGHDLIISSGSTGQLYAQILQGAPFDAYLAADVLRPQLLIDQGLATQLYIYARGQLALLINQQPEFNCQTALNSSQLKYLAIANPDLAPYGLAAKHYLENTNLWEQLSDRLVIGENVSQAMHMVGSKNATAGLVAQSLLVNYPIKTGQCQWLVPIESYQAINQAMVLLKHSKQVNLYTEFMQFLQSKQAIDLLNKQGYLVDFEP